MDECFHCGGALVALRSQNIKKCADCGCEVIWKLAEGQLPLVANNRLKTKRKISRTDIIGTNGNTGDHYEQDG